MARKEHAAFIKKGKWNTLETRWGSAKIHFYFRKPTGAKIRVRYGFGWFTKNRQKQTLDGSNEKILSIGFWGVTRSKIQIKPLIDENLSFDVEVEGPF